MQVVGFNFTKISAERELDFKVMPASTNIEFTEVKKEDVEMLKDLEALRISFNYSISYEDSGKKSGKKSGVEIIGHIILAAKAEETKEIEKSWKKNKVPDKVKIFLFNLILRRCTPKAVMYSDEIGLPSPVPLPKITPKKEEDN